MYWLTKTHASSATATPVAPVGMPYPPLHDTLVAFLTCHLGGFQVTVMVQESTAVGQSMYIFCFTILVTS